MFGHIKHEVLELAIQKKNGNINDAAILVMNESEVTRLEDEIKNKNEKESQERMIENKKPLEKTVDKGISVELSNNEKYFSIFFELMKIGNTDL